MEKITVKAFCGGTWRYIGTIKDGVLTRRIKPNDILRKHKCSGVDTNYDPPLEESVLIRHILADSGKTYEITFGELIRHPAAVREKIGGLHGERVYLPYHYWREVKTTKSGQQEQYEQLQMFAGGGGAS